MNKKIEKKKNNRKINISKKLWLAIFMVVVLIVTVCTIIIFENKYKNKNEENVEKINIINLNLSLIYGQTYQVEIDQKYENIYWENSNSGLVKVDDTGKLSVIDNEDGIVIIKAITKNHQILASIVVEVSKIDSFVNVTGVKLDKNQINLKYGQTEKLIATIFPIDATNKDVSWSSSNPKLVSVDSYGNLITNANENGEVTITVKTINGNYTDSATIIVEKVDNIKKVTGLKLDKSKVTLEYGQTDKITATISPVDATNQLLMWSSSNSNLVTVDNNGNIKSVANIDATVTITAKTVDGGFSKSAKVTIKSIKVEDVKLNETTLTLKYGESTKLIATISPSNAVNKKVTWSSSDTRVATVSSDGIVKAVGGGTAVITVTTKDGNIKATCTVAVDRKSYIVTFDSKGGNSIQSQIVIEGNKLPQPSTPQKMGYIFDGWLLNNTKYNFNTTVTSDMTLVASWKTDYKVVDYCLDMPETYSKDGVVLKRCIKDFIISIDKDKIKKFMQKFSITDKYIYFSSPLNGAWISQKKYTSAQLKDPQLYNEIVDSSEFETISSVFIARVDKSSGESKLNEIKYSGHGQGFDTVSGAKDTLYLTAWAVPISNDGSVGAASSGIAYTSFKESGQIIVPDVTIVFDKEGSAKKRITTASFTQNDVFNSSAYYEEIRNNAKDSSVRKSITSMAIDETTDTLAYTKSGYVYIYSLSKIKKATSTFIKEIKIGSGNQGIELDGDNLYVLKNYSDPNDSSKKLIELRQYKISTGKLVKSVELDLNHLYSRPTMEAEGISIYNGKIYIGVVSRNSTAGYNDIYLVEGF